MAQRQEGAPAVSADSEAHSASAMAAAGLSVVELEAAYHTIVSRIRDAAARSGKAPPRLVAVSKTKPAEAVLALHHGAARHIHFGENYVQELVAKAASLPPTVRWHFIGQLQSNKAKQMVISVPNLWAVESVDTEKLANLLEAGAAASTAGAGGDGGGGGDGAEGGGRRREGRLRVFVQVNTSGEAQKGGVEPGHAAALALHIVRRCPHLRLQGLMTIGALEGESAAVYFDRLAEEREGVEAALLKLGEGEGAEAEAGGGAAGAASEWGQEEGLEGDPVGGGEAGPGGGLVGAGDGGNAGRRRRRLELSMGMSGDFPLAIECGSTSVRVGSSLFGARTAKVAAPAAAGGAPMK